ncbi:putative RNA polymerase II subunit B1 CTD phosphatase rpap2 isoform X2 [Osmerus eperlanus]|uniref:putative RNA polymerase II subunit B1 CTD phosphatase rpap2 isoform X2 n=1 Tax=Osmerus eperlanus TaxID=29151 RepID=UPI002E1192DB
MGGNAVSSLAAIEETRRGIVTETLREKLELEKRALQVVERLLEDSVADDVLVDCARLITTGDYKDTIEERAIAKLCGYPVCSSKLGNVPHQKYNISTKTNKVYDITERKCFCSNFCFKASKAFELQIPNIPLWLRHHENLPEVILMKRGDRYVYFGLFENVDASVVPSSNAWWIYSLSSLSPACSGSPGEEVKLRARRLKEQDIENPLLPVDSEAPGDPRRSPLGLSHSDSSDEEQDFGSSGVSQAPGPRVHWGELPPKKPGETKLQKVGRANVCGGSREEKEEGKTEEESEESETGRRMESDGPRRPTSGARHPSEQPLLLEERGSPEGQSVEEAADLLRHCTMQDRRAVTADPPVHRDTTPTQCRQEGPPEPTPTPHNNLPAASYPLPGLDITQVGMSRRGASGLRGLLKTEILTDLIHVNLLEGLSRTFSEWRTEETMRFLYGPDHNSNPPLTERQVKMEKEEEEELDEDDLDDVVEAKGQGGEPGHQGGAWRPSAPVPDYHTLRRHTEEQELRVKEFYKGTYDLPQNVGHGDSEDKAGKDLSLPLVDSHAQHLIQKRIAVEKLTRSLGVVLGPLCLTMSDVFSDLSSLVRTFRFTNTNIIHKTPEWTLIAVVLLHVLSEVSPEVHKALESPGSVEYLSTLMDELTINAQDLQSLVQLLKTPAH